MLQLSKKSLVILLVLFGLLSGCALTERSNKLPLAGKTIAFFGIHFIDTSVEGAYFGERADEQARIVLVEDAIRQRFVDEGAIFLDLQPVAKELGRITNPARCYGCDLRMGRELRADYVLVGEVQKISSLILSMNLVLKSPYTEKVMRAIAVDIRSNTDESWLRGIRYALNNGILKHRPIKQKVSITQKVAAPPQEVWATIGSFQDMGWHPAVFSTSGSGDNVPDIATRTLTLGQEKGPTIQEALYEYRPEAMRYSYRITDVAVNVLPVTNYSSHLSVKPLDDGNSEIEWRGAFYRGYPNNAPPEHLNDAAAVAAVTDVYQAGLDALADRFGAVE